MLRLLRAQTDSTGKVPGVLGQRRSCCDFATPSGDALTLPAWVRVNRAQAAAITNATRVADISGDSPTRAGAPLSTCEAPDGAGLHEEILAWSHLSAAGFLRGSYTMTNSSTAVPDRSNTPGNAYGVYLQLASDANWV